MTNEKINEFTLPVGAELTGGQHTYTIVEVLGQGGFGITYKVSAQIVMGNIPVEVFFAIKEHFVKGHCYRGSDGMTMEYSKASAEDVEESLRDFKKEADRLKRICKGNKHIVNVNEVFQANHTIYYVMEYIDGGDLRRLVHDNKGGLSEQEALGVIVPIAEAVSYIHQQGIMHLDIKPDNIVIRKSTKEPVLIDFGVSLHFNKSGELTTKHITTGASVGYSPQEQFAGISRFAPEADVYALAATLFYLLVGRDPKSAFDIKSGDIENALPVSVSEKTRTAIANGMKPSSYERTQTAEELVLAIKSGYTKKRANKPLPVNYILHLGDTRYLIVKIAQVTETYIKYDAVRYVEQGIGNGSNITVKKTFGVYECFVKGTNWRKEDNSVERDFNKVSCNEFQTLRRQLEKSNKVSAYDTNGTTFLLVEKKSKPNVWKEIFDFTKKNSRRIVAFIIVLGIILALYLLLPMLNRISSVSKPETNITDTDSVEVVMDSDTLDEPQRSNLEQNQGVSVEPSNEKDSKGQEIKEDRVNERKQQKQEQTVHDVEAQRTKEQAHAAAMARMYKGKSRTKENLDQAYQWALKADAQTKEEIIQWLKDLDYPDF